MQNNPAIAALRHHVSGAIERGEKQAIVENPAKMKTRLLCVNGHRYAEAYDGAGRLFSVLDDMPHLERCAEAILHNWADAEEKRLVSFIGRVRMIRQEVPHPAILPM